MVSYDENSNLEEITALDTNVPYKDGRDQEVKTKYHRMVRSKSSDSWSHNLPKLNDKKSGVSGNSTPLNLGLIQDESLIRTWTRNQTSIHTKRAYGRISEELLAHLHPKNLKDADLELLQSFMSFSKTLSLETQRQKLAVVCSLFSFAYKAGYLSLNPSVHLKKIKGQNRLAERYLSEEEVMRMINLTNDPRDRAALKVLYSGGLRAAELCGLKWENISPREDGSTQIQIEGKGGKVRNVVISSRSYEDILQLKGPKSLPSNFVFLSQQGRGLSYRRLHELVDIARLRAGITKKASPHWLRHAHASHALDRGAPIHLVQATLGHASVATTGRYLHARPLESSGRFLGI